MRADGWPLSTTSLRLSSRLASAPETSRLRREGGPLKKGKKLSHAQIMQTKNDYEGVLEVPRTGCEGSSETQKIDSSFHK